jgi:hypothetical protein
VKIGIKSKTFLSFNLIILKLNPKFILDLLLGFPVLKQAESAFMIKTSKTTKRLG